MEELELEENAQLIFLQPTVVLVQKDVDIEENCIVNPYNEPVTFYIEENLIVDEGSTFNGNVFALKKIFVKNATLYNQTFMNGLFITMDKLDSDRYVNWNWTSNCIQAPVISDPLGCGEDDGFIEDPFFSIGESESSGIGLKNSNSITIIPNPTSGKITINMKSYHGCMVEISIFNSLGQEVKSLDETLLSIPFIEVDLGEFQSGMYMVQILIDGDQRFSEKVVLVRD
jgi:hypothetical protein